MKDEGSAGGDFILYPLSFILWLLLLLSMFFRLRQLLELIRFSHTLFALPFALLAAAMAWAANRRSVPPVPFRWLDLLGILVCMVAARSAGHGIQPAGRPPAGRAEPAHRNAAPAHRTAGRRRRGVVYDRLFAGVCGRHVAFLPRNWLPL